VIDWFFVAINFLWILGLSTILAAFSYHTWRHQVTGRPLALQFRARAWRLSFDGGVVLVALAVALMPRSERWWTRLIALAVAAMFAWAGLQAWRQRT
jgi:hypothetical protein